MYILIVASDNIPHKILFPPFVKVKSDAPIQLGFLFCIKVEKKKSFMFYVNWEQQVDLMNDVELRGFIKNLCRHSNDEEVVLPTREEKLCWLGIFPALEINKAKWKKKVEANQENGKLGGAPKGNQNARKETTQNNPNNLIRDNSKEISDNSKKVKDKRELGNDNWQEKNVKSEMLRVKC